MSIPETPYTRLEMYLDEIARNGGGGGGGGGGSSSLSGLTDVDISNPTDGQTLVYNATSGKWENGAGGDSMFKTIATFEGSADFIVTAYDTTASINTGIKATDFTGDSPVGLCNVIVTVDGITDTVPPFNLMGSNIPLTDEVAYKEINVDENNNLVISLTARGGADPMRVSMSGEFYTLSEKVAVILYENP